MSTKAKISAFSQLSFQTWILIIGLIFGGCCSNNFTLEKLITNNVNCGNILTFTQFLFITIEGYFHFFDLSRPPLFIRKSQVPLKRWSVTIGIFFIVSVLNNAVFLFDVSMPLNIILRSSGTVFVMLIGCLFGKKRYCLPQVLSALILTIGIMVTTLFKDNEWTFLFDDLIKRELDSSSEHKEDSTYYFIGIGILFLITILMAGMSLYNEETYRRYGKHWQENIFYCHFFGLPMFLLIAPTLVAEFKEVLAFPEVFYLGPFLSIPKQLIYLLLNVLTQILCVRGANYLAGHTTALTVSVVLLLRKFVSLLLSLWIFDNRLSKTGSIGASLVFIGAFAYSYSNSKSNSTRSIKDVKNL